MDDIEDGWEHSRSFKRHCDRADLVCLTGSVAGMPLQKGDGQMGMTEWEKREVRGKGSRWSRQLRRTA